MQIRLTVLAPHAGHGAGRSCDVLVTAPAGTALAAVASALAAAVSGPDTPTSGTTVLYAGRERLDGQRSALGEPPLVDGAVITLQVPGEDERTGAGAAARLHVVAGPDAGGVHLLHGGPIRVGRSMDADVPLDDPDVSRMHCAVTVGEDGRVTVADLGSTNGTTLDGTPVGDRPVRFRPGALLRLGESALRLTGPDVGGADTLPTTPDGEGHLRVGFPAGTGLAGAGITTDPGGAVPDAGGGPAWDTAPADAEPALAHGAGFRGGPGAVSHPADSDSGTTDGRDGPGSRTGRTPLPGQHGEEHGTHGPYGTRADATHGGGLDHGGAFGHARASDPPADESEAHSRTRRRPPPTRGRRGIGAWARRLAGGREDTPHAATGTGAPPTTPPAAAGTWPAPDTWPDPAAVLLTVLGPGPRLWERGPDHPESLVVRLGTADRAALSGVPVTVGLREVGSLGLAGPGNRLAGLARSVVAQLAALHSPADLEIVLISADRARPLEERRRAWAWLGWLPHLRPAHGQDCRLLLAYDRDQAQARAAELTRRLDEGPLGPGWPSADRTAVAEAAARHEGPVTVVIVDGDPGTAALRETTARLAGAGAAAGIHLVCLAEAPTASPVSPVAATYESACAASLAFRECGAVALLSGDVATALRLLRTAGGRAAGHGTIGVVDAVSVAWADRFGRALAPLRTESEAPHGRATAAALPPSARLLDELGLARATPASLMARWASAGDGTAVLGAGPRGPVSVDLAEEGPHLLIEGPAGSGRTELLRSVAASLAAGGRPDRLGLLLVDGAGGERGEGLGVCTELPHVTEHLVASDPVRMRAFAQALGAELKRRAELLGDGHFADRRATGRLIAQRPPSAAETLPVSARGTTRIPDARTGTGRPGDGSLDERPSGRTSRSGADDLTYLPSGRTLRTGEGPVGERVPRAGAADLTDRPGGRVPRVPDGDLGDRPSGRLPLREESGPQDRSSGRLPRAASGDLGDRPSGRVVRVDETGPEDRFRSRVPRGAEAPGAAEADGLPRLVVLVDDYDALVAPALGAPGRPAAGSVVRALEAVARGGARLGVHLVATSARPDRTADTEPAHGARLRIVLDAPPVASGPDGPAPGRGRLGHPDGRVTPFQAGRVTGRIPRTATLRPTVVPLEWERMGDPPTRRPVRELGNGPTDLALLASALERAARSVEATPVSPLTPAVRP
ncbi:FHA domain-containing protein [Streptomyces sp. NPDC048577]|uniref:FHA domain-containing protein n=1 Tax=Streptomyces sp. NPDC048577 TaxID=3157209 RepID=UPI0034197823